MNVFKDASKQYAAADLQRIKAYVRKEFPHIEQILKEADRKVSNEDWAGLSASVRERKITKEHPLRNGVRMYQSEKFDKLDYMLRACGITYLELGEYAIKLASAKAAEGKLHSALSINWVAGDIAFHYDGKELSYGASSQRDALERSLTNGKKTETDPFWNEIYKEKKGCPNWC